jgi:hypothetical protein
LACLLIIDATLAPVAQQRPKLAQDFVNKACATDAAHDAKAGNLTVTVTRAQANEDISEYLSSRSCCGPSIAPEQKVHKSTTMVRFEVSVERL